MANVFFLSYARPPAGDQDHLRAIDRFFEDLRRKVIEKLAARDSEAGFRDARGLMAGSPDWTRELAKKMQDFPIGIVLLSPWYLSHQSPWCRWEHQFLSRRNEWAEYRLTANAPKLLLVVDWVKTNTNDIPSNYPATLQRVQESIAGGDAAAREAVRQVLEPGLLQTMELVLAGNTESIARYRQFTAVLASYVMEQWRKWESGELAANKDVPTPPVYDPTDVWISPLGQTNARRPPQVRTAVPSRRKVVVIYIAAQPGEVDLMRAWRYQDDGESDWHAFAVQGGGDEILDADSVGALVAAIPEVEVERLHFSFFSRQMEEQLRRVALRYPVLFIVDPWTVTQLKEYRETLSRYAQIESKFQAFACPVVIWNEQDTTDEIRTEFAEKVSSLFNQYRWEETSHKEEFAQALANAIKKLQRLIRNARADRIPAVGTPPPRISSVALS